jgi:hypothetical protein
MAAGAKKSNARSRTRPKCRACIGPANPVEKAGDLCASCARRKERDDARAAEVAERATMVIRRLDGSLERLVTPTHFHARERRVLTLRGFGDRRWDPLPIEAPIGDLLSGILAFLHSNPAYIHSADLRRHATMLRELMDSEAPESWMEGPAPAVELPIRRLEAVVHNWINGYWSRRREVHPLMLSFAINTAELIEQIAFGTTIGQGTDNAVDVEPAVGGPHHEHRLRFLNESSFRRQVTMDSVGGLLVLARIPQDAVIGPLEGHRVLSEFPVGNQRVGLRLVRCHLSQDSPTDPGSDLSVEDPTEVKAELGGGFEFRAELLVIEGNGVRRAWRPDEPMPDRVGMRRTFEPILYVPARWFTDVVEIDYESGARAQRCLPVPVWTVE